MPRLYGTTTQNGYGGPHQALRATLLRQLQQAGMMPCARCGKPIYPGMPADLGHTPDRTAYTGLEHARCNRSEGATRGNRLRGLRRRRLQARTAASRQW